MAVPNKARNAAAKARRQQVLDLCQQEHPEWVTFRMWSGKINANILWKAGKLDRRRNDYANTYEYRWKDRG